MATAVSSYTNGQKSIYSRPTLSAPSRFSDIPSTLDVPTAEGTEAVEVSLEELVDDPEELCTLLADENANKNLWMTVALAYAKEQHTDTAINILDRALHVVSRGATASKDRVGILSLQCWLYLLKSRQASRITPDNALVAEARTKDFYLQAANAALNEASRVHPGFPPLFLARGIISLLRASIPAKVTGPSQLELSQRNETLRQALKCFEDAARVSSGRNMMALLGKAKALFSLGRYADSLECYQEVLMKVPDLQEPDPRLGIGCCLWQLNHPEEAREAWERSLGLNPNSKIANILIGLYHIRESSKYELNDPLFAQAYKQAMTVYTSKAYKLDKDMPLVCVTFGNYFLPRQAWSQVDTLARKSIDLTDVNAIASDGWYLLARKEHYQPNPNYAKALDFYNKADLARGGGDKGYLPAKFGAAQTQILLGDVDGAKFRLEKIIQHQKNLEAMVVLGTLYANETFSAQAGGNKEDKSNEAKKAINCLEAVRTAWKDPKKLVIPDSSVLICLARLYEIDQPEKSVSCLMQAQQMALDGQPEEMRDPEAEDQQAQMVERRKHLPPQLLNNIGCFQYQLERSEEAIETFQIALDACRRQGGEKRAYTGEDESEDREEIDKLVTTISYNLARSYEVAELPNEAKAIYEGLLNRHADYIDAHTRKAFIELQQDPSGEGPKTLGELFEAEQDDMEVRSLYAWYLHKAKKRTNNIAEDQEQRHYKRTLQNYDKHDQYSLTGMGNLFAGFAREMRRDTDADKDKRRKQYEKAAEFYQKAIQLDPKNAYAAQGFAIILADDRKDLSGAVQIFSKVKDAIRDSSIYINLGHIYGELKQYSRSIESYESAVSRDRANDPQILASLGRIWLLKGKSEKSSAALKTSLDYSYKALALAPEQIHFKFNIAFVQIQLAQLLYSLPEPQRILADLQAAAQGLDEAIETFSEIAKAKNPPYPRHDIEQRANMGRNTMRRQLERAIQSQREYEEANASKLAEAKRIRDEEVQAREAIQRKAMEAEEEKKRQLIEQRTKLLERSRELADLREAEDRQREEAEWTENSDGERVKRRRKKVAGAKRKKKGDEEVEEDGEEAENEGGQAKSRRKARRDRDRDAGEDEEGGSRKKRRRLTKKTGKPSKYKSSELVEDSDLDDDEVGVTQNSGAFDPDDSGKEADASGRDGDGDTQMRDVDEDEEDEDVGRRQRKNVMRIDDDEDEEDGGVMVNGRFPSPAVPTAIRDDDDEDA